MKLPAAFYVGRAAGDAIAGLLLRSDLSFIAQPINFVWVFEEAALDDVDNFVRNCGRRSAQSGAGGWPECCITVTAWKLHRVFSALCLAFHAKFVTSPVVGDRGR